MLNKFLILLVTSLVCLLFVGAASAVTNSEPVDRSSHATVNSAIDGHQLVYEYEYSSTDHDIYKKDMVTGTTTVVTRDANDECNPDISGNIVVWQSRASGGKWQIYWKDISTSNAAAVHASSNDQINPSVSGTYVVWKEYFGAPDADTHYEVNDYDIKGYDLATHTYYANIASSNHYEGEPDISGNTVVYAKLENVGTSSSPNWKTQIYKTTFGTNNQGTKIHPYTGDQNDPVISGTKVIWEQYNKNTKSDDIWFQNLATNTGFWVTQTTDDEHIPAIAGNIAVWQKWTGTTYDIVMQDISKSSNPKKNVAKGDSVQWYPAVGVDQYGIFVSFTDDKDGTSRVYWRNMDSTVPIPTSGSPARNAVDVPVNKIITTTFSEPIKLGAGLIKLVSSSGVVISITKSVNGKILTITPTTLLKRATKYTLILAAGSVSDYA